MFRNHFYNFNIVISDTTKNIPSEIKIKIKGTDWRKIAGLRDILSHAYFAVDKDIIHEVILYKLPELKVSIEKFNNEKKGINKLS